MGVEENAHSRLLNGWRLAPHAVSTLVEGLAERLGGSAWMCGASWWCGGDSGEGGMRASSGDAQTLVMCCLGPCAPVECGRWGAGGMWTVRESRDGHAARWMVCDSDAAWSAAMDLAKLPW